MALLRTPSPSALNPRGAQRPTWQAFGLDIARTSFISTFRSYAAFLRMVFNSENKPSRNGRTDAAMDNLENIFACLNLIDFDKESKTHFSATYDHFDIHEARFEHELKNAAWLRAEAYSEQQPYTRYVDSFKKKFAEQEFTALKRRAAGQLGSYVCLVAVSKTLPKNAGDVTWHEDGKESRLLGTLDFSLHHPSPGEAFGGQGLPYGYIANVCVDKSARKQGIASALMECAVQIGRDWGLNSIYIHTHALNEPAFQLYVKKGFEVLHEGSPEKLVDGNLLLRLQM